MLLQQEKSGFSEQVANTHSNRISELENSPKKLDKVLPKPPKEEERIQLNNKKETSNQETDNGIVKKKGCC